MLETFTSDDRLLLERGWPHLRVVTDDKVKNPAAVAEEQYAKGDSVIGLRFPRSVANAYLWAQLHPRLSDAAKSAAARTEPFDEARVAELIDRLFPSMELYGFHAEDALYLLEALFGTERAAGWLVDRLERMSASDWARGGNPHDRLFVALEALGWMLRRLGAPKALRKRLEKVRDGREGCHARSLDVVLDGRAGWARVEDEHVTGECCFIASRMPQLAGDAEAVRALIAKKRIDPWNDPQLAMAAGAEILNAPIDSRSWDKARKAALVERFGLISDPLVLRPVALFAKSVLSKSKLREWLRAREGAARPVLEAVAKGDAPAKEKKVAQEELALLE